MLRISVVAACMALFTAGPVEARIHRSASARQHFKSAHRCPANDRKTGPSPGYTIDHPIALCVGGSDTPGNLRSQRNVSMI